MKMNLHHPLPVIVFATGPMHSTNPRQQAAAAVPVLRFWLSAGRRLDEVIREAEQDSEARKRGKSFIRGFQVGFQDRHLILLCFLSCWVANFLKLISFNMLGSDTDSVYYWN